MRIRVLVPAAAVALLLSACSSGTSTSAVTSKHETSSPSASPTADATSFPIPNGMYNAKPTRKAELAKGFTNEEIDRWLGRDGKGSITIVLHDGSYEIRVVGDDGVEQVGELGTYTATRKLWIATSQGSTTGTYRWSFDGKVLSLKLVSDSAGPKDFRIVRLVTEHDYVKVG